MNEFYFIGPQGRQAGSNTRPGMSTRVSPISINLQSLLVQQDQNLLTLDFHKAFRLQGLDIYITKVSEQRNSHINDEPFRSSRLEHDADKTARVNFSNNFRD